MRYRRWLWRFDDVSTETCRLQVHTQVIILYWTSTCCKRQRKRDNGIENWRQRKMGCRVKISNKGFLEKNERQFPIVKHNREMTTFTNTDTRQSMLINYTYSLEQREGYSSWASQEKPHTLWNTKINYGIYKSLTPVPIVNQINSIHAPNPLL